MRHGPHSTHRPHHSKHVALNTGPRAQAQLLVRETGKRKGQFSILMDLDSSTMRALGQFLIDLADRAETLT